MKTESWNRESAEAAKAALDRFTSPTAARFGARGRYLMDATMALVAIALLMPLFLLISLLIKLDSRGPVLFRQKRLGKDLKEFTFLKFRSMYVGSDPRVHEESFRRFSQGQPAEVNGKTVRYKPSKDPRVTRVGRWLRATALDELPQLLNVLAGHMSLVGPRPAIPYELAFYQDWHYQRFKVLPGLTGMWQVYGRSQVPFETMMKMDVEYVSKRSVLLDLKLLLLTIPVVLTRKGGY